ncbi:glutamate--cysteine ligase [Micrococcus sp. FDAARGOS_333]|uniref:glutamate--cysteine ligase n=1 Tax=Micrococcus sp. FDAARGOS_333 TaxID=1930558 RepID=UPI000B4E6DD8|nr:glutamate--cysteine ligase [Micrococcus sp. FDAARGOS_333]PNL18440.1 glutamate--cysteine ligase [Micrococcus sp. FDAARGOS_333]
MTLDFAHSDQSTLGIEWELALVDAAAGDLRAEAPQVIEAMARAAGLADAEDNPHVTAELLENTVELVTGVHRTVGSAVTELGAIAGDVLSAAEARGLHLYCQGSHPFAEPYMQKVTDKERYGRMVELTQYWGRQMLIFGVHVHVGLDDVSKAMPVVNGLVNRFPHLLALSASSPFWAGLDTGYQSQRTLVFQQLPTAGLPFQFEEYDEFVACVEDMVSSGMIEDPTECRWDVRAVPRLGTVEMRVCDGMATLEEIGAVTALTQCLVHDLAASLDKGATVPVLPPWYSQENKWRAARYGMDAKVIIAPDGTKAPVGEHLSDELDRLAPVARELGCEEQLAHVHTMMAENAAHRQRRIEQEAGAVPPVEGQDQDDHVAPLRAVVRDAAARTRRSLHAAQGRAD